MDKLYLDTNFLLDLTVKGRPGSASAAELFDMVADGKILAVVSSSSLKDFYYIARRDMEESLRRDWITLFLDTFDIAALDWQTCRAAVGSDEPDYEDALMLESARREECSYIVSRDEAAFLSSLIPKVTASEYLGR